VGRFRKALIERRDLGLEIGQLSEKALEHEAMMRGELAGQCRP
jgi:hypothetical protein